VTGIRHKRCAVVGVARGAFTREILALEPTRLVLVDPWRRHDPDICSNDDGGASDVEVKAWYQEVPCGIGRNDRVEIIRDVSTVAAAQIADRSLDFIYIDPDHRGDGVGVDLRAWWPKVQPGGWLTGHDYEGGPVQNAVTTFCAEQGVKLAFVTQGVNPSWAIQVPG
jgi:GNAT superfamily N-acetyltransferase